MGLAEEMQAKIGGVPAWQIALAGGVVLGVAAYLIKRKNAPIPGFVTLTPSPTGAGGTLSPGGDGTLAGGSTGGAGTGSGNGSTQPVACPGGLVNPDGSCGHLPTVAAGPSDFSTFSQQQLEAASHALAFRPFPGYTTVPYLLPQTPTNAAGPGTSWFVSNTGRPAQISCGPGRHAVNEGGGVGCEPDTATVGPAARSAGGGLLA